MTGRTSRRGQWSVQELERLRQLLPRRGVAQTAALLRRSPASVQKKAFRLLRVPPRRGDWTDSDDSMLREAWGAVEPRLLGAMLGRSIADVRRRAVWLRAAVRSGPWTHAERLRLKDLFGTRSDADLEVCLSRRRDDVLAMAQGLCLARDKRSGLRGAEGARMPRWTPAEVERLRQLYADRDNLEVARLLGRTVTSVANKANLLGLHKSPAVLAEIGRQNVGIRHGTAAAAAN
ncbi:MAG: hypothetical protein JNK15_03315 [Planctomycetes bacterium]|nr:hypothetical protein [Planctomycetota bacterium]